MYKKLDIENWSRKPTFEFFRDFEDPFFNMTANVDVTGLYNFCKENELSIAIALLYCSQKAANEIREFRIRLLDGELVEYEIVEATQTILQDDETFSFCYYQTASNIYDYVSAGRRDYQKYKSLNTFDVETDRLDLIYYSVIPWISFTSFKHASRLDKTQTVPRIVFGKIFEDGAKKKVPVSVEVNHTIMDGIHVGKYYSKLQENFDSPG
ncbi:MAG: chloramphenicol acetyltransferase [Pyrinomonadaceae bacterium]|nr:chloramphenicol acetyltransferase [Pyrinomonadaceae bacterium]